jgi:hypothetical protein
VEALRCKPIKIGAATDVKRKTILLKKIDEAKKEIFFKQMSPIVHLTYPCHWGV